MVFNAASVGVAVTPTVLETTVSHYFNRRPRRGKPTAHLSYDAALNLIRQFLIYSSHHTVEEVQSFTAQWVPAPQWVKIEDVAIPTRHIEHAARHIQLQLGPKGIEEVGGLLWWQWRRDDKPLHAEWVEMKKDYNARVRNGGKTQRSMLYVHGGGYYFGSVDEHRYQIQRHARKLNARVLCPRYRLSPQFPFPCGLLDCLATYLFMLQTQPPETIILAGDSAGGGMVLALQIIMRDQGIPLPAGSILISPWVDLTHSFPSVAADNPMDYIPPYGFHHRPSEAWPPPNSDDLKALDEVMVMGANGIQVSMRELRRQIAAKDSTKTSPADGYTIDEDAQPLDPTAEHDAKAPGLAENLSIVIDGVRVELKDQIQMYAQNSLLSHPLVSPVLQASLGGLPPMQVCVGGGEMLRDEQIYLAHKAAHPTDYPPPPTKYADAAEIAASIEKYPPTKVQLQVWDDMCHVGPTLSFTRPAKYMFRSIAQFGAWALATAQDSDIGIMDDDDVSDIGTESSDEDNGHGKHNTKDDVDPASDGNPRRSQKERRRKIYEDAVKANENGITSHKNVSAISLRTVIGKAGDPLPPFHKNMIRQRVTRHGDIYPLAPASKLPACNMSPENIGVIKTGPVRKWLDAHDAMNKRYASAKRRAQLRLLKQRKKIAAESMVFVGKDGNGQNETPPPAAMASRKKSQLPKATKHSMSLALGMWSGWNSKHDEEAIANEEDKIREKETVNTSVATGHPRGQKAANGTTTGTAKEAAAAAVATAPAGVAAVDYTAPATDPGAVAAASAPQSETQDKAAENPTAVDSQRPTVNGATVPFKIRPTAGDRNPSTMTLTNHSGVVSPTKEESATETDVSTAPAATAAAAAGTTAVASSGKLHKQQPVSKASAAGLQREDSNGSWAKNVLRRSGFGSLGKSGAKQAGSSAAPETAAVPVPAVDAAGGSATSKGDTSHHVAVDAGEVVDADKRPEPTRFETAQPTL